MSSKTGEMLMIRSVASVIAFMFVVSGVARAAEDIKLGYVDLQRAVAETEEGKRARATLKKDFELKQKELDERQSELKKSIEDLEKKRTLLGADLVRQKEGEIQKKMQEAQQILLRHQQGLAQRENDTMQPIIERMQRIIFKMAQTEGLTMVFDKNQAGVIFAKPHLDLSNELIRRFNSGEEGGGKGAPKPAAAKPAAAPKK
jgi:outer membrane protein